MLEKWCVYIELEAIWRRWREGGERKEGSSRPNQRIRLSLTFEVGDQLAHRQNKVDHR